MSIPEKGMIGVLKYHFFIFQSEERLILANYWETISVYVTFEWITELRLILLVNGLPRTERVKLLKCTFEVSLKCLKAPNDWKAFSLSSLYYTLSMEPEMSIIETHNWFDSLSDKYLTAGFNGFLLLPKQSSLSSTSQGRVLICVSLFFTSHFSHVYNACILHCNIQLVRLPSW